MKLEPCSKRPGESERCGEDETDGGPHDGPQRQFALEETAMAFQLPSKGRAMAVKPLTVALQFQVRGGDDAA